MTRVADRVKESAIGTGTGNITLTGAKEGFRTFAAGLGVHDTFYYAIELDGAAEFEVGIGRFADVNKNAIVRTSVVTSSNAGALVDFTAGAKTAMLVVAADDFKPTHEVVTGSTIQSSRPNGLITLDTGAPAYVSLPPSPLATPALGVEPRPQGWATHVRNRSGSTVTLRRHESETANTTAVNGARGVELPDGALATILADDQGWRVEGNLAALTPVTSAVVSYNNSRFTTPFVARDAHEASTTVFYTHASETNTVEARLVADGSVIATYTHTSAIDSITVLDENHVLFIECTDYENIRALVLTLTGNTLTAGAPVTVASADGAGVYALGMLTRVSTAEAIAWWADDTDIFTHLLRIGVTGDVPSLLSGGGESGYDFVNTSYAAARVDDSHIVLLADASGAKLDLLSVTALDTPIQRLTSFGWTEDNDLLRSFPVLHVESGVLQMLWTTGLNATNQVRVAVASISSAAIGAVTAHQLVTGYRADNIPPITSYGSDYIVGVATVGYTSFHHLVYSASATSAALISDNNQAVAGLSGGVPVAGLLVSSLSTAPTADYFIEEVV